jgi:lysozyme family protein
VSIFEPAIEFVLSHEGGYSNQPADKGGPTNFGLSQRQYPTLKMRSLTREKAIEIYRRDYWRPEYEQIRNQVVANKVFDIAVNTGERNAALMLQRACGDCGYPVEVDGIIGPLTIKAANQAEPFDLLQALRARSASHYQDIAANDPTQKVFLRGWLSRASA